MYKKALFFIGMLCFSYTLLAQRAKDAVDYLKEFEKNNSEIKTLSADFLQTKRLSLFKDPIVSRGKIYLKKPGLFAWRSIAPIKYNMVIKGMAITQWDEDSKTVQKISFNSNPAFSTAIDQMKLWFYGNYSKLSDDYDISVVAEKPLTFKFVPRKDFFTAKVIDSMNVIFNAGKTYLRKISIAEKSGDTMEIDFSGVAINPKLEERIWEAKDAV
jgi:outer membrane lipoprotein-sorting protein